MPGSWRTHGGGNGTPLQYSCLEDPMDRGAWRATVGGITESDTTATTEHAYPRSYSETPCLPLLIASHFQPELLGHSTEAVTSLPTPPSFMVVVYSLSRVWLFATIWTIEPTRPLCPWDFSVHAISQAEYWKGLEFPSSGHLPDPGIEPESPALAGGFFPTETPGTPKLHSTRG